MARRIREAREHTVSVTCVLYEVLYLLMSLTEIADDRNNDNKSEKSIDDRRDSRQKFCCRSSEVCRFFSDSTLP